jgi:hypothetical protein
VAIGITVGDATTRGAGFTVLSDKASRAMAYVGMTRGKDENHAFIYQSITGEADHEHARVAAGADVHVIRRGNNYSAAHYFRMILAGRPRCGPAHVRREELPPRPSRRPGTGIRGIHPDRRSRTDPVGDHRATGIRVRRTAESIGELGCATSRGRRLNTALRDNLETAHCATFHSRGGTPRSLGRGVFEDLDHLVIEQLGNV